MGTILIGASSGPVLHWGCLGDCSDLRRRFRRLRADSEPECQSLMALSLTLLAALPLELLPALPALPLTLLPALPLELLPALPLELLPAPPTLLPWLNLQMAREQVPLAKSRQASACVCVFFYEQ